MDSEHLVENEGVWVTGKRGTSSRQAADVQWPTDVGICGKETGTDSRNPEAEMRTLRLSLGSESWRTSGGASLSWLEHTCPIDTGHIGQAGASEWRNSYHQRIRTGPVLYFLGTR